MPRTGPSWVEIAGLPGVGKTTAGCELSARLSHSKVAKSGIYRRTLRSLQLVWLFSPYSLLKFRRVFSRLGAVSSSGRRAILSLLNVFMAERCLATIEARIRGRALILDEGFVQRGLGIWLRAPESTREDVWLGYLDCIPKNLVCVILTANPSEARERAQTREAGLSKALRSLAPGDSARDPVGEKYAEMQRLLAGDALRRRVRCIEVAAEGGRTQVADRIIGELAAILPAERLDASLLFLRESRVRD